ncbi:HAD-superfamily hydrolase, subfamily IA, variant 3 [Gloeocapsa sp. PCC 7428]|uniref:HAD family hydrolase n=1 Tax=Gloeocapsa sp. PCC 7428 TaxID=1173026 RepID=UPI0002A5F191|nr:HAD-IA family hydrolase [Gloeocapsa sp. PCC 7428]AFZ33054.1 HAD-superfamily hydrolase, subfamily IA, variant 3 [Gloeocapsa sp. PCC 7428]
MLAAILYDLDGTIVNTDPLHYQVWREILQEYGIEIDEEFYKNHMSGRLNPQIVRDFMPEWSTNAIYEFSDRKEARFRQVAGTLTPLPGLSNAIAWGTERGLKQALVTNAPRANAEYMLEVLQLSTAFDRVVISAEVGIPKPDPAPYEYILKEFGITPGEALAFEDSPSGMRSAVAAGIKTVGIATTQEPSELYELGATLVIPDYTDSRLWELLGVPK